MAIAASAAKKQKTGQWHKIVPSQYFLAMRAMRPAMNEVLAPRNSVNQDIYKTADNCPENKNEN